MVIILKKIDYEKSTLRIFAGFYRPHIRLFILDMCCALLISGVDLLLPLLSRYALSELLPQNAYGFFFALMGGIAAAYLLKACLMYIVTYWGHTLGVMMEADMRRDLFNHLQSLPFKFYDQNRTGHIMSRVTTDLFEITELAHHGPEDLFISLVTLTGAFAVLFTIRWQLAVMLIIMVPITLLFTILQRRRMSGASRAVKERTASINADIESSISGARVAKAFTNEDYEMNRFSKGNEQFKRAKGRFYSVMAIFHSGMDFMMSIFSVLVITFGGYMIMQQELSVIDLLTFTMYVSTFLSPIRKLTQFFEQYTTGMAGFHRFVEIMRVKPDITDSPDAVQLADVKGEIEFNDVTFAYNDHKNVLSDVSLNIPAGKMLALVGPSGGGKTTLCHLLPRFYEVSNGLITIDGTDIKKATLQSLRRNIGIVSQDVFLFAGTVRENIAYGRINASEEEIIEAARLAEIYDTILELPDGLDTEVGERGVRLSGGQKQRISIARIFLKNPPVLILDEATSALDTVTERRIQQSFDELAKGRTTLVIAHRLSTVRNADEIVYIDENGICERGRHEDLLVSGGLYAALYNAQSGENSCL